MQRERLKYSVIIPVHNEEKYLADLLHSLVEQTYPPYEIIVVDDNSTDETPKIIEEYAKRHSTIKSVSSESTSTLHEPGNKIIHAFYKGFYQLSPEWDVISKLDADVILPKDYYEKVISAFESDPKIGIAGGIAYIQKEGKWIYEDVGRKDKVRGPIKSYSQTCFHKIKGLKRSIGWDTVDGLIAEYYGFKIKVIPELHVKLQKPTGQVYKSILGIKTGQAYYRMRYGLIISFVSAVKASQKRKNPKLFFSIFKGYFHSVIKLDERIVTREEGRFIRKHRWNLLLKNMTGKQSSKV